jgi:hypothetical protein
MHYNQPREGAMSAMAFNLGRDERHHELEPTYRPTNYPSQCEAAWILSLRLYGFRVLSIREGR